MAPRLEAAKSAARPRRGTPDATRRRLVEVAAGVFNQVGYLGTDSNRLARAAGYAPGTFYKHFPDKRAAFLATYEAWVANEWDAVGRLLEQEREPRKLARRLVQVILAHHRRWRGLRASLRGLVPSDDKVRLYYQQQRRRQLGLLAKLRTRRAGAAARADDAMLLYCLERVCDAVADGELASLGVQVRPMVELLEKMVERAVRARRD